MFEKESWSDKLPISNLEIYEPNLKLFFETMFERQCIWYKRFIKKIPQPWTEDKIFQNSKFTNVYRDLDRNSQWQIKHILLDNTLDLKNLLWKLMVFRFFNNPETFTNNKWQNGIPNYEEYDENEFSEYINYIRSQGKNPFTAAYLIGQIPGTSRDYCYTHIILPKLHKNINTIIELAKNANKPEEIIKFLKKLPGVGNFMAHEFYTDFTYIQKYTSKCFMKFDQNDFTNVGPGSSVGIRLIYPNLKTVKQQKNAIYWLRDAAESYLNKISKERNYSMPFVYWNKSKKTYYIDNKCNITLHQIEMWLCEFQKYWKMIIGQGKQRSNFKPQTKELIV